jgi:outer membrane cobalamin receptor
MGKVLSVTLGVALLVAAAACADGADAEEVEVFPGDPIVITAIGEPARESEVPFGIKAITGAELQLLAADNLAEGLVRAEGVYVREYGGAGASKTVSVRGAYAKQTLVMVDGQPINNHQGGDVDFNALTLEDVERVEVMAGASSALYGANATAGVVNVITRGVPEESRLSVRGGYGTNEKVDAELAAGVPIGAAGVSAGGNFRRYGGFRENDDYEGKGGHLKFSYAVGEEATVSVRGQYQTSELGVPGKFSSPTPFARQEDDFTSTNAGFDGALSERLSANARFYFKNQERHYVNPDPLFPADDTHKNDALGGRVATFYQLLSWNRLAVGGEYEKDRTDSTQIGKRDGDTWAVFTQEDLRLGELTTVLGVRYDSSGIYGDAVSPRLGLRYRFNDYVSARAAAGRGFRAPTFDELFWPSDPVWGGGGNPDLKPEYSWAYEAGPTFWWRHYLKADLTYFYSDYEDLISGWPPKNVSRAVVQGLEASITTAPLQAVKALELEVATTYLKTKARETGEQLDYRPVHTEFAELRYRHDFGGGAFAVTPSVSTEIVGRQQYTDGPFKRWLDAYVLLNARLAFKIYYPEIYVAGKNLTAEEYQTIYDYPMPGRTVDAGLAVSF